MILQKVFCDLKSDINFTPETKKTNRKRLLFKLKMEKHLEKVFNNPITSADNRRNSRVLKGIMQVVFVITLLMLVFVASYKV
jgi:hypothetical protein